jgi:hypothetical protein
MDRAPVLQIWRVALASAGRDNPTAATRRIRTLGTGVVVLSVPTFVVVSVLVWLGIGGSQVRGAPHVVRNFCPDAEGGRELFATVVSAEPIRGVFDCLVVQVWVPRREARKAR